MVPDFIQQFSSTLPIAGQGLYMEVAHHVLSSTAEDNPIRQREERLSRRVAEIQELLLDEEKLDPDEVESLIQEQSWVLGELSKLS